MKNWIQEEIDRLRGLNYSVILQLDQVEELQGHLTEDSRAEIFIQYDRATVEALNALFAKHNQNPPTHEIEKIANAFLPTFKIKTENLDLLNNDRGIFVDFVNQPL